MSENSSSSNPLKLLWQGFLIVGLVLGCWVISQLLPIKGQAASSLKQALGAQSIKVYALPQIDGKQPSTLGMLVDRVNAAQSSITVVARQVGSKALLEAFKAKQAAKVSLTTVLSPDVAPDLLKTPLVNWMRENQIAGVYKDLIRSASHIIIIDEKSVFISDLPFTQSAYEPTKTATTQPALGFLYVIEDAKLAQELSGIIKNRLSDANRIL